MLVGLGLGPGDPELLTLRAVRLLTEADAVYVPGQIAKALVSPYRVAEILDFPMTEDQEQIRRSMEQNADQIAATAQNGLVVLGILGDPNFYSTFSRLCAVIRERYPAIVCSTEPGVSSITAFASVADLSLSGGFIVSDGAVPSSQILLKVKKPQATRDQLKQEGFSEFVLVERMFMDEMKVYRNEELQQTSDYFSIMFARR
jgi:precorrin-2/cobalt-factor-2 C20-methyltransferase